MYSHLLQNMAAERTSDVRREAAAARRARLARGRHEQRHHSAARRSHPGADRIPVHP